MFDNAFAFITGGLNHFHGQPRGGLLQGVGPCRGASALSIPLNQNEIRDRLNRDQARFWMKGLILADRDLFRAHAGSQALPFGLTELPHRLFQSGGDLLLRAVGGRHKVIESGEF
jgi:hypothetical protein